MALLVFQKVQLRIQKVHTQIEILKRIQNSDLHHSTSLTQSRNEIPNRFAIAAHAIRVQGIP